MTLIAMIGECQEPILVLWHEQLEPRVREGFFARTFVGVNRIHLWGSIRQGVMIGRFDIVNQ